MEYSFKNYKAECENLKASKASFNILDDEIKKYIRLDEKEKVEQILPFLLLNTSMIVENYLYKILNSKHLSEEARGEVYKKQAFVDKWETLINKCVTDHYGCEIKALSFSDRKKYNEILAYVGEIKTLYELRNKFAHGELKRGFNNDRSKINCDKTKEILSISYFGILRTKKSFDAISDLLLYTVDSPKSFSKYFDDYYEKFEGFKNKYDESKYEVYRKEMIFRHKHGIEVRKAN